MNTPQSRIWMSALIFFRVLFRSHLFQNIIWWKREEFKPQWTCTRLIRWEMVWRNCNWSGSNSVYFRRSASNDIITNARHKINLNKNEEKKENIHSKLFKTKTKQMKTNESSFYHDENRQNRKCCFSKEN